MNTKRKPDYRAYTIIKRDGHKDVWLDVGAGFQHGDKSGVNIVLHATPLDGRIVLRPLFDTAGPQT